MDTNYLKTGNLTVNNVEIGYGIHYRALTE